MLDAAPAIPARDSATEFQAFDRADRVLRLLAEKGVDVAGKSVVDLGTGFGFLAIAAAQRGASHVVAIDANPNRLDQVEARASAAGVAVETRNTNLLRPDALPDADIAFLIGVVEYAGLWEDRVAVADLQRQIFRTAYESLRPGGLLVFGSKNRIWPRFLVDDVHRRKPLLNVLPRRVADWLSLAVDGVPYRHHIHSPRRWRAMVLAAGFSDVETYYPHFSYQFPLLLRKRPSLRDLVEIRRMPMVSEERRAALSRVWPAKGALMALGARAGLPLSHSIVLIARR